MTIPASAVATNLVREPAQGVPQPLRAADRVRETAVAEIAKKKQDEAEPPQTQAALAEINQTLKMASIGVQFEFDKEADTMIAKVVDVESGEVIRQMPSAEMVRMSKALGKLQGLLVHQAV